jgi:hypothetical protein
LEVLTKHIQLGGDEVAKTKESTGSETLSMAYHWHIRGAEFAI